MSRPIQRMNSCPGGAACANSHRCYSGTEKTACAFGKAAMSVLGQNRPFIPGPPNVRFAPKADIPDYSGSWSPWLGGVEISKNPASAVERLRTRCAPVVSIPGWRSTDRYCRFSKPDSPIRVEARAGDAPKTAAPANPVLADALKNLPFLPPFSSVHIDIQ